MEPFRPAPNTESHLPVSETSDALRKQIGELALLLDEAHAQLSIRALKIANLERALFTAVEPLEALNMVGNADGRLSIEVWQAIIKGIEAVRSALARTERRS